MLIGTRKHILKCVIMANHNHTTSLYEYWKLVFIKHTQPFSATTWKVGFPTIQLNPTDQMCPQQYPRNLIARNSLQMVTSLQLDAQTQNEMQVNFFSCIALGLI